jgi:hypothetical protein
MNSTILQQKLKKGLERNRDNRRQIELQPPIKLMPFRALLRRRNALGEAFISTPTVGSFMAWLPNAADEEEKAITASQIADAVIQLAAEGDVTVTAVSVMPDN